MKTVPATHLKNHLGAVLRQAALGPVGVERHGKVIAWLVPARTAAGAAGPATGGPAPAARFGRAEEERLLTLCAANDFRPSRWRRAGPPERMAGIAALLAPLPGYDIARMLALAEQLSPGMSQPETFGKWLKHSPVDPARFLPMLQERIRAGNRP